MLRSALKTILDTTIASTLALDRKDTLQNMAIEKAVHAAWFRIQDVTFADLTLNGTTQRWALSGEDIAVLPLSRQLTPIGVTGYTPFSSITTWTTNPDGTIAVEQGVKADGTIVGPTDSPVGTISSSVGLSAAAGATLRVWYARRVQVPTGDTDLVRLPNDYARAMSLFSYCELLALADSGSDVRDYKTWAAYWQAEASLAYEQAVPPVLLATQDLPLYT